MPERLIQSLPHPSDKRIAIQLFPRAERAIARGHPWLFAHGIKQQRRSGEPGDLAVLFDRDDRFLAVGLYDPLSPIRVRVLQHGRQATIDRRWFAERIAHAWRRRTPLLAQSTTGFRVVNGANDGLPGLIIDRYSETLVIKLYTHAWIPHLATVVECVREALEPGSIVLRLNRRMQANRAYLHGLSDGALVFGHAVSGPVLFRENGITFEADVLRGQKTGFFLDQRDNRLRVEKLSRKRSVLNVFSYTGGFSVYAARGGATEVVSVDLSSRALDAARRNFQHNQSDEAVATAKHELIRGDAFAVLSELRDAGRSFDVVIVDPPAFAKAGSDVENAIRSYQTLVRRGLGVMKPGGTLVSASCSSRIDAERFARIVRETGGKAGRPLQLLDQTGHAIDHPISFPEGEYLTCVFATDAPRGTSG